MKLILIIITAAILTGCAEFKHGYDEQVWTPDGFSYTLQRDRKTGDQSDYWGLSWSLKGGK